MRALTIAAPSADAGLVRYLDTIKRFPMLEANEEYMLAKRWHEHGEVDAAHQLVTSHLRLVAKVAIGFRHYGLPVSDLISEGNIGLMRAVKKFEPDRGFRLATYALWWIKAAITEYVLNSWSLVKIGTAATQKKLFFNLRRIKLKLKTSDSGDLTPAETKRIAADLGVSANDVRDMNRRMAGRDASLNTPTDLEGDAEWQDSLIDATPSQEAKLGDHQEAAYGSKLLSQGMENLTDRERHIIVERRLKEPPATLETLADEYGISRERVRQIEVRAFAKLQDSVKKLASTAPR
jgi:RNA polymerase sigma-32 factor